MTDLPMMQITTNVIVPGVEMSIFIAMPDTTVWSGTIRRADAPRHGRIANLEGASDE